MKAAKKRQRAPDGWRRVSRTFWWRPDVGSATKRKDGWWASSSGYDHVILTPNVGPFRSAYEAMREWERVRSRTP